MFVFEDLVATEPTLSSGYLAAFSGCEVEAGLCKGWFMRIGGARVVHAWFMRGSCGVVAGAGGAARRRLCVPRPPAEGDGL